MRQRKEQEHNRMQAVRMHYQGMSASEIAKIFDVSP
ncbi:helix-turn-helix domain-containing protein [Hydrogenophaga sp.]